MTQQETVNLAPPPSKATGGLVVVETHPVQYHAPVYRAVVQQYGVPLTVLYGSDFSVTGYTDKEFGSTFRWDSDLLSGYPSLFLSQVNSGGAASYEDVTATGLGNALHRLRPDVLLIPGYANKLYRAAIWQALGKSCSIMFRGETTDHAVRRNPVKRLVRDVSLQWFYRRCRSILYIGRNAEQHYRRLGVESDKLTFSPYCVDQTVFQTSEQDRPTLRSRARQQLSVEDSKIVILFSGKLQARKGPNLLLEAIKRLSANDRDRIVTVFLGAGPMMEDLRVFAGAEPQVSVRFPGFQNQSALSPYYHAADVFTLPSLYSETWGLVVNEAMHHGVPCVVSDAVGCAADLIRPGTTGEIASTCDSASLAAALTRVFPRAGHLETRQQCRQHVSRYTVDAAAEGIAIAYRRMLK